MLLDNILALKEKAVQDKNVVNSYLPYRNKNTNFDYEVITGGVLSSLLKKKIEKKYTVPQFKEDCQSKIITQISAPDFFPVIEKLFFTDENVRKLSPEFLLFAAAARGSSASSEHLITVFHGMLSGIADDQIKLTHQLNFIEKMLLDVLANHLQAYTVDVREDPFLPFLAEKFKNDLIFMSGHSGYLMTEIENVLRIYAFLYTAQLALNINQWRQQPVSKPLYFILDTEKASQERSQIRDHGYSWLRDKIGDLFPMLSLLEYFNNSREGNQDILPLWKYGMALENAESEVKQELAIALYEFLKRYSDARHLELPKIDKQDPGVLMEHLIRQAKEQFRETHRGSKSDIHKNYIRQFEQHIAQHFVRSRGRAGNVLVLNQDNLLLLTNLVIGDNLSLRFQELLKEFAARGLWFDKQSEQALLRFYERIGNVDRMSDSGDAVYVRKTI